MQTDEITQLIEEIQQVLVAPAEPDEHELIDLAARHDDIVGEVAERLKQVDKLLSRSLRSEAIALAEAAASNPSAIDDIIDLANAISMDAEDLKTDLGSAVNAIADIHTPEARHRVKIALASIVGDPAARRARACASG